MKIKKKEKIVSYFMPELLNCHEIAGNILHPTSVLTNL